MFDNLSDIFDSVAKLKIEHCVVCLRSSQTRLLKPSSTLNKVLQKFSEQSLDFFYSDLQNICTLCEKRLGKFLETWTIVLFAIEARKYKCAYQKGPIAKKVVKDMNKSLKWVRHQTELVTTEVQMLSSESSMNSNEKLIIPNVQFTMPVGPTLQVNTPTIQLNTPTIQLNTPPIQLATPTIQINPSTLPMLNLPSLQQIIVPAAPQGVQMEPLATNSTLIPTLTNGYISVKDSETQQLVMHKVFKGLNNNIRYVPSLNAIIKNNIMEFRSGNKVCHTSPENIDIDLTEDESKQQEIEVRTEENDTVLPEQKDRARKLGLSGEVGVEVKKPKPISGDFVDWEDKIPRDIITYGDSVPSSSNKSLGFITEIRSEAIRNTARMSAEPSCTGIPKITSVVSLEKCPELNDVEWPVTCKVIEID